MQTYLGNCLEEVVSLAVQSLPWVFQRSPNSPEGLISPDFLRLEAPAAFIAVTSTPSRNTFQKKKWRYVHEIFSLKQYYSPRPTSINLNLSPPAAIQPTDKQIPLNLFDVEIELPKDILNPLISAFEQEYEENETSSFTNRQRQVQIRLAGNLVLEEAAGINMVTREIQDTIYARNDFITSTP